MCSLEKVLILSAAIHAAVSATLLVAATTTTNNSTFIGVTLPVAGGMNMTLKRVHQRTSNSIGTRISKFNSTTPISANNVNLTLFHELSPHLIRIVKQLNLTNEELIKRQISRQNKSPSSDEVSASFGGQASASLFKPYFLKGLLGRDKRVSSDEKGADQEAQAQEYEKEQGDGQKSESGKAEDDEEEVTQTIEIPMKADGEAEASDGEKESADSENNSIGGDDGDYSTAITSGTRNGMRQRGGEIRPKAAASLQLTSTEMNSILNDQEGPEYYRMRELIGDGVLVNEERRIATAASTAFGPAGYTNGGFGGFDGETTALAMGHGHRLLHSASEDASEMGLLHRFGAFDRNSPNSEMGRFAQSPNEYSEMYSNVGGGGSFGSMGDYPGSGLIRAGSGDGMGYGVGLGSFGAGGYGGYPNSPMLDGHSSELYGGAYGGSSGAGFGANSQAYLYNRLATAASQEPAEPNGDFGGFGANGDGAGGGVDDEYTSRYGHPFDQRGFASQNRAILRDNSMGSHSGLSSGPMKSASSPAAAAPLKSNPNLVPLSPIIPMADEVSGGGQASQLQGTNYGFRHKRKPMEQHGVPSASSSAQEDDNDNQQTTSDHHDDAKNYDSSTQVTYNEPNQTMLSEEANNRDYEERYKPRRDESHLMASNDRTGRTEMGGDSIQQQQQQSSGPIIEFARVGGAGYLAPRLLPSNEQSPELRSASFSSLRSTHQLSRKTGGLKQSGRQDPDNYDPTDNPAHAGKFIIE